MTLPWTREEAELARKHYSLPRDEFRQKVGRTKQAARAYLKYISNPSVRKRKCEQKVELRKKNRADVKTWSAQETEIARDLFKRRESDEVFLAVLGRSKRCAESRLHRVDYPSAIGHYADEKRTVVPPEVMEDRNKRLMAGKSLTAWICGDPEPNRRRV